MANTFIYIILVGLIANASYVIGESSNNCTILNGTHDLSRLNGTWRVIDPMYLDYEFDISLCDPLHHVSPECDASSVCMTYKDYNSSDLGSFMPELAAVKEQGGFMLFFHSGKICKNQVARSNIHFMCGPHLGYPKLVMFNDCVAYFQWKSYVACDKPPLLEEVPCYVYDDKKNKIDLTPLIKQNGAYNVSVMNDRKKHTMIFNVCSKLSKELSCSNTSAACEVIDGFQASYDLSTRLRYEGSGAVLEYKSTNPDKPRKAKIIFTCPGRLNGGVPHFLYTDHPLNTILWPTEYACPEHYLKGDVNTCSFTEEEHGVNIDLSPLKVEGGYEVKGVINGSEVSFVVNVCGPVNCSVGNSSKRVTACMLNPNGSSTVIGAKTNYELKYADSSLSLMYDGHSSCEAGMKVTTIINFLCDKNMESNLTHVYSDDCIHVFEMKTKHACISAQPEIPCIVSKGNQTIDLGRLATSEGELWSVASEKETGEFHISVCKRSALMCGHDSSACKIDEKGNEINLGQFVTSPVYNPEMDMIMLEYKNGSHCNGTTSDNWTSTIYFKCMSGHPLTRPFITNVNKDACHYEFEWHTAAACPYGTIQGKDCKVYDPVSGISFDLSPLKSSTYHTESELDRYYISICEPFVDSLCMKNNSNKNVGVCRVSKNETVPQADVIGEVTDAIQYSNGLITLEYPYENGSTTILFICSEDAVTGKLQFLGPRNGSFIFYLYTNLVCEHNQVVDCMVQNNRTGDLYDFSSLMRTDQNWVTYYNDSEGVKKSYISICKALVPVENCSNKASACIVNALNGKEMPFVKNAGTSTLQPEISSDGILQLQYNNGDSCVSFGKSTNYSTYIHFLCSNDGDFSEGLKYLGQIGKCTYTYLWTTPAACPSKTIIMKDSCYLRDTESGFIFDLSSLTSSGKPYSVTSGNETYMLNICDEIKGGCRTSNNTVAETHASVCMASNDGHSVSTLAISDSYILRYHKGNDLQLVYKHNNQSRPGYLNEVIITFPCSQNSRQPQLKFSRRDDNIFFFEMETSLTCMSKPFICQFQDSKGNEYDLHPLAMKYGFNWIASDNRRDNQQYRYHVTFCHPLNRIVNHKCPVGAAACQIDVTGNLTGISLGSQFTAPVVNEDGGISVVYTNGSPCPHAPGSRSARINIFCSHLEGHLTFVDETADCEYIFSLNSPAACPLQTQFGYGCSVADPNYGYQFDLTPLKDSKPSMVPHGDYEYLLSVCKPLENVSGECIGSAACQTKPTDVNFTKSLGVSTAVLMYDRGIITLKYTSGTENCHEHYNRSTVITFTCDHNATALGEGPSFIAESESCSYMFEWPTTYACPPFETVECSALDHDGHLFDLSPLSLTSGNYYVKNPYVPSGTFVLNVCRSIVHSPESMCAYSAAACIVNPQEASVNNNKSVNIGEARRGPYFDGEKLMLKYTSGARCDVIGSTSLFMETVIEFTCDEKNVFSQPEFVGRDKCTYYFDWSTAYACHYDHQVSSNNCTVSDPITGLTYDLNPLKTDSPYVIQNRNHMFYLSICQPLSNSSCEAQSGVCQQETDGDKRHFNAGKWNSELKFEDGILFLNYTLGDSCHGGKYHRNAIIHFRCGKSIGKPEFLHESSECAYYFVWETQLACQFLVPCAFQNGSNYIDMSPLSLSPFLEGDSDMVSDNAKYYFRICGPLGSIEDAKCPPSSSICRVFENGTAESLGLVHMAPFTDFIGTSSMIFTNGSECDIAGERKRSRIQFICDPNEGVGVPTLVDIIRDYCTYVFRWKTSIVCPSKPEKPALNSCTYKDVGKGIYFDLTSLRSDTYYEVNKTDQNSFMLNVCGAVKSSKPECSGSGVCFQSNGAVESYGQESAHTFSYDGKRLRMILTDGSDCPSGINGKRSAQIFFTCHPFAGVGKPYLHKQYTCSAIFMWETNLVCRNIEHQCAFDVGTSFYDLHLLSSLTHNWNATDSKGNTYWLNLCRGIVQNAETSGCPQSSAVCMKSSSGVSMPLGMVYTLKAKKTDSSLMLIYKSFNNLGCSTLSSPGLNATTKITLKCGTTLGSPKLMSGPDSSCNYDFTWETILVCPKKQVEVHLNEKGFLYENDLKYEMDLNPILHRTFEVFGTSPTDTYKYLINFEGVYKDSKQYDNACKEAAVCQSKPNQVFFRDIGSVNTMKFYKRGSGLHLVLTSRPGKCGKNRSRNVTTIIILSCSTADNSIGAPTFMYESGGCDYIFEWDTYVVCSSFHRPDDDENIIEPGESDHFQKIAPSSSHKAGIVISFLFLACIICYVIFVLSKAERRAAMASKFRVCFSRVSIPRFRYKRGDMLTELQSDF